MSGFLKKLKAATVACAILAPASVHAFGGPAIFSGAFKPVGVTGGSTVCAFNPYNDPGFGEAEISMFTSAPGNTSIGGTWWSSETSTTTFNPVTVADLETDCPFSNVDIEFQSGADASSYSAEDLYELVWTATFDDDGQSYRYRIALEGVSTTTLVNTRTLNTAPNVAPTANAGSNQSVQSGNLVTLDGSGSTDSDGTIASYAWTRTGGTGVAGNATLSSATAQNPTFTDSSLTSSDSAVTHIFSLVVTDDDGASSVADTVTITITPPPNVAPTATASATQTSVTSGTQVQLLGSGADTDGTIASYAWSRTGGTGGAGNASLGSATAQNPTFTDSSLTSSDSPVTHIFELVVTDNAGAMSVADSITITINPPTNAAPTANAGPDQSVESGVEVQLAGSGTDTDGTIASYTWTRAGGTGAAGNAVLSSTTAHNPTFTDNSLTPFQASVTHIFDLVVTDNNGAMSVADSVTITITAPPNVPATANAGPDQTVASAASVTLDGSASDANNAGQTLTFAWSQTSGTTVSLSSATAEMPTFTAPTLAIGAADETLVFSLTVDDGGGASTADAVSITVEAPANTPPTANAGPDQTVASAASVTLDGTASDANDAGQTLQYSWAQIGGTSVTLSSATAANPSFTAPVLAIGASDATLTFEMTVFDGFDTSAIDSVVVTVEAPANTAPTANAGPDQTVAPNASVTLNGSSSAANDAGQTLTYVWTQTAGTPVTLSNTTAESPTFTSENLVIGDVDSVLTFSLVVNDGIESSVADSVTVTVDAPTNTAPTANAGPDQTVAPNASVTLNGAGSAANDGGQSLTYAWTQTGGAPVTLSSVIVANPSFTAPNLVIGDADAVLTFSLIVDDGFDPSVADTVTVTVTAPLNTAPTADSGADQIVANGVTVTLDGTASDANDAGQSLTYAWSQTAGPGVSFTASAAQPTFTAPVLNIGDSNALLTFQLVVNDGFNPSVADTVVITVLAPEDMEAPVITPPAAITAEAGPSGTANVTFAATVTDNFDPVVTPVFTLSGDTITSPFDFPLGVNNVLINASDAAGNDAVQQTLVVTITAGVAPDVPVIAVSDINADRSLTIGGTAEAGATVQVTFPDGDMQSVTATGGTYSVTSAANMTGGTVSVTAADALGNTSAAATVDLFPDYDGPTVTITGTPSTVVDQTPFDITITFSETVSGFEQGDLSVTGADVTAFAGSGAVYTAQITPQTDQDIMISIASGVAEDAFTNPNEASDVIAITNAALTETEEMITQVTRQRTTQLIQSQPQINRFLLGGFSGRFNANVTQGAGNFDLGTASDRPVWLSARGQWSTQDELEGAYANFTLGSHYKINDGLLIGAMAQFDRITSDDGAMAFESNGWLVGPYAVARLPEQNLVFSGAYLAGQSDNTLSPLGTYEDEFMSDRSILTLGVAGELALEQVTLIPLLDLAHVTDENEAYRGGDGFDVRSITVTTTEATLGLDFILPMDVDEGTLDLIGGFGATASVFDDGVTRTESSRAQVELGASYGFGTAGQFSVTTSYDGIGDDSYESFGASALLEFSF